MQKTLVIFTQFSQQELQTADDFNYYLIKTHMQPTRLTKLVSGFLLVTIKKNNTFLSVSLHLIYPNPTLKFNKKKSQNEIRVKTL